jgi:hypothetical protein
MTATSIIAGVAILLAVFAVVFIGMARTAGIKEALVSWAYALGFTGAILAGAFLISAGMGKL